MGRLFYKVSAIPRISAVKVFKHSVNKNMSLEEFKKIYFMEYAHRMAGRFLGAYFFFPSLYFMKQNWKNSSLRNALLAINILIGFQGLLGWYMVKSGLSKEIVENNQVPRVSHFRLAAHLGSALVIYAAMLKTALTSLNVFESIPKVTIPQKMIFRSTLLSGLVFCTAISGALVAGLDAGMIYNMFPLMGNSYIPTDFWPQGQTFADLFNNPSAVQFMHRNLAITTIFSTSAFWLWGKRYIPHRFRLPLHFVAGVALAQGALGVLTLLYTVPISLASAHQAGSVTLLTSAILLQHQLKKIAK